MTSRRQSALPTLDFPAKLALILLGIVWVAVTLAGGSARADVILLVPLRLIAVVAIAVLLLLVPNRGMLRLQRAPLLFVLALALLIAMQLVPLPPGLWESLPGREPYGALADVVSVGPQWRPLSLAPDLTWNSLLSLLPPLAFILCVPLLGWRVRRWLLLVLWFTILASGFLGLLQMAGGPASPLRFYQFNNSDSAIGFFANRNHQAVFLAMGVPLSLWWVHAKDVSSRQRRSRWVIAASAIFFLLTAAVMTQSRMGAASVFVALILSGLLVLRKTGFNRKAVAGVGGLMLMCAAFGAIVIASWPESRREIAAARQDLRIRILPESMRAAKAFLPLGAGYGSVPHVFPRFEEAEDLSPQYVNHTHSELTQLVIEGGIFPAGLLVVFLIWYVRVVMRAWREKGEPVASDLRICSILVVLPLFASITDYPLRTPLMACALAFAATFLALGARDLALRPAEGRRQRPQRAPDPALLDAE